MLKDLEHHEHAEHMAHGHGHGHGEGGQKGGYNNQMAALLIAVLAAGLALTEMRARMAEIIVQQRAIDATDAWAQYQAKSTRGTFSKDLMEVTQLLGTADPEMHARREKLIAQLKADQKNYESDPKDGKHAIAERAKEFEHERDHAMEQVHAFHNGVAAIELGIVLTTASAIIKSRMLIMVALGLGIAGGVLAVLGLVAPEYGALAF